ncbi:universal stress protein [Winogradskyella endarachnes]|uniref:Universal stress protein n=1 Tax=Winogradskyella endarachnes TaxID=2681965 RepID=A0A6L6UDT1_9FLAO|nr:universal stress protein [Winogradskyella endarachnes]MUU79686.1 universal stress protein [Winogradskyella endarachnes]
MKNILLPTDFSENSWNAIRYAMRFFEKTECNFYLLHVNRLDSLAVTDTSLLLNNTVVDKVYTSSSKQKLRNLLKEIAEITVDKRIHKFFTLSDQGSFIESIRKTVNEKQIDCIVMGTKGASEFERIILGTNTADVITKVKCNVLAIPENAEYVTPKEVAFPTDFSLSNNLQVLEPMAEIIERFKTNLRILHISGNKDSLNAEQIENKELLEDYFSTNPFTFHYLKNKKVEDAIECFVESRAVNLICMVAKNLNYFQQILFHSKVEKISYHVDIPFLVLHEID